MEIVRKAYEVKDPTVYEFDNSEDNWQLVYAKTFGEAKSLCVDYNEFTNIRARRASYADKVMFEGREIDRSSAEYFIKKNKRTVERTNAVNKFPDDAMFFIQNGFVGNSVLWWALNSNGYTTDITRAQKYTKKEVLERFVCGREEDRIWEANHVLQNIRQHVDGQYLDREFLA